MELVKAIRFKCPVCGAEHSRGFLDGVSLCRCLRCGYQGHAGDANDANNMGHAGRRVDVIVPFRAPGAPEPEPEAVLRFGDVEIRLTLTYLHHLVACQGWGDRASSYADADRAMSESMKLIEVDMWARIDAEHARIDAEHAARAARKSRSTP